MALIAKKYQERQIRFTGLKHINGWNFKLYEIVAASNLAPDVPQWNEAFYFAMQKLSAYHSSDAEIKAGYIIYHKGFDSNYIVISWWSHENMLRMFAFAAAYNKPSAFNEVTDGLNLCVWDMLIHAHERDAYVKHVLTEPENSQIKTYLDDVYH